MINRKSFEKFSSKYDIPFLLNEQVGSFETFLQPDARASERDVIGLQSIFADSFPITDSKGKFCLEFVEYSLGVPKYTKRECKEIGMSYQVALKAVLSLSAFEKNGDQSILKEKITSEVYLGEIPYMTENGSFIINGAERVIVSQLHRSPGVFFDEETLLRDKKNFKARVIPVRGAWLEFIITFRNIMYVSIDRRRKMPATLFLRALGISSNEDILDLFYENEKYIIPKSVSEDLEDFKVLARPVINEATGELIFDTCRALDPEALEHLIDLKVKDVIIVSGENRADSVVVNTLLNDKTSNITEEDIEKKIETPSDKALCEIFFQLRNTDAPNPETAKQFFQKLFFDDKRYDFGKVGRYKFEQKLGVAKEPVENSFVLSNEDLIKTISYLVGLYEGQPDFTTDDIDHLGNRRARTVGELLRIQFGTAFMRMSKTAKDRLSSRDTEKITPKDLINARSITNVVNSFFGSSQLSQFLDETNPLSALTHKRRITALGPGGLSRDRAGFEVRDVHYSHYGRLCPIETPEGPNIGLISSLCTYARFNDLGFLESPYRKVENGIALDKLEYLTAYDEDKFVIAQSNANLADDGTFLDKLVVCRRKGEFPSVKPIEVNYIDVAPVQIVSMAAALIPFLEHDDANRALMGSNMQRQAVPLLITESPVVGTGIEVKIAEDSGFMVLARFDGVVEKVYSNQIIVRRSQKKDIEKSEYNEFPELDIYNLEKFVRSNQDTCQNQRPIVSAGDTVKKGDTLADGAATDNGELALGKNVTVAFMPWNGYNFEDAIIVSEKLLERDTYTSIHITDFQIEVRETKRGPEEITIEIPNISEEAVSNLDENGIIRVGAKVEPGDILVGKVTPKGEVELSPEERLLRAIFGEKAADVRNSSLKAPPGLKGVVIGTNVYSRKDRSRKARKRDKAFIEEIESSYEKKIAGIILARNDKLVELFNGYETCDILDPDTDQVIIAAGTKFSKSHFSKIDFSKLKSSQALLLDDKLNKKSMLILHAANKKIKEYEGKREKEIDKIICGDELKPGVLKLIKVYIAKKRVLAVGDKMAGRHGNKGVISRIVPVNDMPFMDDGTPVDIMLNPLGVPSRMNVGQLLETHLGLAASELGLKVKTPIFNGASYDDVLNQLETAGFSKTGKMTLRDGRSGYEFDNPVTVGKIYMIKLAHLVEDKLHARSIGPYSLVTQQPLGGKSQFGGQRFGEMEVWALEAYGAAYTLQELLTVKSDDVIGRAKVYEAIVKGENLPSPNVPEAFNVLLKEVRALCIDMRVEEL